MIASLPATDALWLETFQRVCGRMAHELKGALNGVSLNLEVVRSRSQRPDMPSTSIASFVGAAAEQFDTVMDMTDALLALSRTTDSAADVAATVRWMVALLGPAARADGGELRIEGPLGSLGTSSAEARAVRLAIGAALLSALDSAASVVCRANGAVLEIDAQSAGNLAMPAAEVVAAVKEVHIEFHAEPSAISITFPH